MKKRKHAEAAVPHPANDNNPPQGGLDPRIRIIARAIGHQIAREHYAAWERSGRRKASNDNVPAGPVSEVEGRKPEG